MEHCGTVELRTERLLLRPFRESDAQAMYHGWTSDARVAEYTSWNAHTSPEETKAFLRFLLGQDPLRAYNWILELDGSPIGTVNVCYADDALGIAGIAYALSHDHWGKGYVTEAVKAVIAFLFDTVGYRKIIAGCDVRNIGSQKVMEKVGMRREACLRQQILRKDGTFGDDLQYGLFREEFLP